MFDNSERKWSCPVGNLLWSDLKTDAERIDFLKSGQAIATGVIAPSVVPEIIAVYRRLEKAEAENAKLRKGGGE